MAEPKPEKKPEKKSKNQRRRERERSERQSARALDDAATVAIDEALRLAPVVAEAASADDRERIIDVEVASVDAAKFVRKRANEALRPDEWHDVVAVTVWDIDVDADGPLSTRGAELGFEIRIVRRD